MKKNKHSKANNGKDEEKDDLIISYLAPRDTKSAIGEKTDNIDNFNLKFYRFPLFVEEKNTKKFVLYKKDEINIANTFKRDNSITTLTKRHKKRVELLLKKKKLKKKEMIIKTDWRLSIGLGAQSVYETSLFLHHIYGFPYIPGQAIKGVVRNYVILELFDGKEEPPKNEDVSDKKYAVENEDFVRVFGSQERQGSVYFFDAYPINIPKLKIDVMNPHYSDYYQDTKNKVPPADYLKPVPIFFLAVEDTSFRLIIGMEDENISIKGRPLISLIKDALKENGVGAKTAVGYGHMTVS